MADTKLARNRRKVKVGTVVSNKMDKTAVVRVERTLRHPFYQKVIRLSSKLKVHDEENKLELGDEVEIMETRPISKDKNWRLVKVLSKGKFVGHALPKKKVKKVEEVKEEVKEKETSK